MRIFMTGATGFIGSALVAALHARGDQVLALTRGPALVPGAAETIQGDPTVHGAWGSRVADCDAVVHLGGESIGGKRWSRVQKQRILGSRVSGTRHVVQAIEAVPARARPRVLLTPSGVDYYPFDAGDRPYGEDAPSGDTFLADVCRQWEGEAARVEARGVRGVRLRTGVVLGSDGGALARMTTPFKLFVGGPVGDGRAWFSWVHLADVVAGYLFALDHEALAGPVNLVAPEALCQREFAVALGKALHRPSWAPVPGPMLRLAVGELAEYLLHGRRVVPAALEAHGFSFRYPDVASALAESLGVGADSGVHAT